MAEKPRQPPRLGTAGRRLWRSVADVYELRPDEQVVLEKAARTADDCERLDLALLDEPLLVAGSMGQQRHNPLLHEARQTRALLATLLKQLNLAAADEPVGAAWRDRGGPSKGSQRAMKAARARWGTYGA